MTFLRAEEMNCLKELYPLRTQRSIQKTCGENGVRLKYILGWTLGAV